MTTTEIGHYINGEVFSGDRIKTQDVFNPATGPLAGKMDLASTAHLNRAVAAA